MSVTTTHPTKVGQRVQEAFTDSRGWVRELGERNGVKVAVVDWDEPQPDLAEDDSVFPVDALFTVKTIILDLDMYNDPSLHPQVEYSYCGAGRETHYVLKDGFTIKGLHHMRIWLLGYHES